MTNPLIFADTSPRFGLPMLFAGQAQKESFVNEAHALIDGLIYCAIEGMLPAPPADPVDGSCWLVDSPASGDWSGQEGRLAMRQAGQWLYVTPRDGMRITDLSSGQEMRFFTSWQAPDAPREPSGGSVVDTEARSAIVDLLGALRDAGVFAR